MPTDVASPTTLRQLFDQPDEKHEWVVEEVIDECSLNLFTAAPRLASQRQVGVSLIKWRLVARSVLRHPIIRMTAKSGTSIGTDLRFSLPQVAPDGSYR